MAYYDSKMPCLDCLSPASVAYHFSRDLPMVCTRCGASWGLSEYVERHRAQLESLAEAVRGAGDAGGEKPGGGVA